MSTKSIARPRRTTHSRKPLTLADLTITWREGEETRTLPGADLARLILYARRADFEGDLGTVTDVQRSAIMLRGLAALHMPPDAGTLGEDMQICRDFLEAEVLEDVAAVIKADSARPEHFGVQIRKNGR